MKFRSDFVTNSSSSGFVAIHVELNNGQRIQISKDYDTGSGGYFWNSSAGKRNIMKYNMSFLKNGEELLSLLAKGIDSFDEFVLGEFGKGQEFRSKIMAIHDFKDVKSICIKEETSFDDGYEKSAELRFENKPSANEPVNEKVVNEPVNHIELSAKDAGKDWTVKVSKKGVVLSNYSGKANELTVPAYVDNSPVIAIKGAPAKDCPVTIVNIPDTVKELGSKAFRGSKKLCKVNIEDKNTVVKGGAFFGCPELKDENGCIIVGGVLHQCRTIGDVVISSGITEIPHRIGWGQWGSFETYHMTSLIIPEGVEVIKSEAFYGQNSLEAISLPSTLKEIEDGAFKYCSRLRYVTLPEGIRKIGNEAFSLCESMLEINFPDSLEYIGDSAFAYCKWLYADAPNHVAHIGVNAFYRCYDMADKNGMTIVKDTLYAYKGNSEKVVIPEGIENISESCFCNHDEITELVLPSSLKSLGAPKFVCYSNIFKGCNGLADTDGFVIVDGCLWNYIGNAREIKIPDGVTIIHEYAIEGADDGILRTVIIPASVDYVAEPSFKNVCVQFNGDIPVSLPGKVIRSKMAVWIPKECYQDGFYISGGALIDCISEEKTINVPQGVTHLTSCCLYSPKGASVVLPDSVERIDLPLNRFGSLLEITIPEKAVITGDNIPPIIIKGWAGSPAEEFVKTKAKHCTFVKVGETLPVWKTQKLKDGTLRIEAYPGTDQEHVVIPEQIDGLPVSVLGKRLFSGHMEIKQIDVPKTVTTIETECFYNTRLTKVNLSEGLKIIGMMAFRFCCLDMLEIPASVEKLNGGAVDGVKTVIVRGNPQLVKNLDIFNTIDRDAKVYAGKDTEVYKYLGRQCLPLEDAPQ